MARFDNAAVLTKLEASYGVDNTPTGAANAMLFQNVDWAVTGETVERPRVLPHMGNDPFSVVARGCTLTGEVDLSPSGAVDTPPAWAPLMRACGFAQTITVGTRVDYSPVSSAHESVVFYHYLDGTLHRGLGARGDVTIEIMARQIPKLRFSLSALYAPPTAALLPAQTLTSWLTPLAVEPGVTDMIKLGGNDLPFSSFRYTHGNRLVRQEIPGRSRWLIEGRAPSMEITVLAPDALSPNLFSMIGSVQPLELWHGQGAGNVIYIMSAVRILPEPRYSRGPEGEAYLTLQARPEPTLAGNDEFNLRVR